VEVPRIFEGLSSDHPLAALVRRSKIGKSSGGSMTIIIAAVAVLAASPAVAVLMRRRAHRADSVSPANDLLRVGDSGGAGPGHAARRAEGATSWMRAGVGGL
jgi:hypothetical protein